jgi:hypothetical protein
MALRLQLLPLLPEAFLRLLHRALGLDHEARRGTSTKSGRRYLRYTTSSTSSCVGWGLKLGASATSAAAAPAVAAASSAAGTVKGASAMAPDVAAAADSPPATAGGVASSWGAVSASGAPARASPDVGRDGGVVDVAASPPVEVEGAGWGPHLPARDSLGDVEVVAGQAVLANIIKIRIQKLNETKKNMSS